VVARDLSLLTGAVGVLVAAADTARVLADEQLPEAISAATPLVLRAIDADLEIPTDYLGGLAGILLGLVTLEYREGGPLAASIRRTAGHVAQRLLDREMRENGLSWWTEPDRDPPQWCGLAHGASGVAVALHRWGVASQSDLALAAAERALTYERAWAASRQQGWPDLRYGIDGPGGGRSWCNGAVGIALARLAMLDRSVPERCLLGDLTRAIHSLSGWQPGAPNADRTICHGEAGLIDLFIEIDRSGLFTASSRVLDRAAWPFLSSLAARDGVVESALPDGEETPGLHIGSAGVLLTVLRIGFVALPAASLFATKLGAT
jgi:lantibiotic biosynthesis protein